MRRLLALTLILIPSLAHAQDTLDPAVENDLTLEVQVDGLSQPTGMEFLPDGRLVIIQKTGEVYLWDGANRELAGSFTVQTNSERGLIGLAVDPMFAQSRRIYFYHSTGGSQRVSWATLDGQGQLDTANATTIIQNLAADRNHDGGGLQFGPDGYLYIGVGDTGCNCGCDPGENTNNYFATCLTKYHGKILRIDRDGAAPAGNPLVGVTDAPACGGDINQNGCNVADDFPNTTADPLDEIYLWGFRNPWRFTFDAQTGYLWIGDVGEVTFEEITISKAAGEHHGWPFREGMEGQDPTTCKNVVPQSIGDCVPPAYAYPHNEQPAFGQGSITGGVFSNHCSWPAPWHGLYWFGDYNKARVWALTPNATRDGVEGDRQLIVNPASGGPVHFTTAPDGSIWYTTIEDGQIWRIAPANPAQCPDQDAGVPDAEAPDAMDPADSGAPPPDDSGVEADAGELDKDAGTTPPDAGSQADTGTGGGDDEEDEDCDCTAADHRGAMSGWIWIGLFVALRTLRRRRDR